MNMKRSSWLLVALGIVVVGAVVYAALGQGARQATQLPLITHDANDIYWQLDALSTALDVKLTDIAQRLAVSSAEIVRTTASVQQWEYKLDVKSIGTMPDDLAAFLTERGNSGWELVWIVQNVYNEPTATYYIWKRPAS